MLRVVCLAFALAITSVAGGLAQPRTRTDAGCPDTWGWNGDRETCDLLADTFICPIEDAQTLP